MNRLHWQAVQQKAKELKINRWLAGLIALSMFLGLVTAVSAFTYTVRQGDTLYSISRNTGTTVSELATTNGIANPNMIHVGQQLEIPSNTQAAPVQSAAAAAVANSVPIVPSYNEAAAQTHGQTATYHANQQPQTTTHYAQTVTYVVQRGDTLYRIAQRFGTSVAAVSQANNIVNVHQIHAGQVLVIPTNYPPATGPQLPPTTHPFTQSDPTSYIPSTLPDAPLTPATTETNPMLGENDSCTRFNFAQGRDAYRGSIEGLYVLKEANGSQLASWYAYTGEIDSGWITGIQTSFDSVHVSVVFFPAYGGGLPIQMEIVNPAGGTTYGWLTRGICHSVEIQYPAGY